jgi:YfiH family protein
MFRLPNNVKYKIFDQSFKASSGQYILKPAVTHDTVLKNLESIKSDMQGRNIFVLNQKHEVGVYYCKSGSIIGDEPKADSCYTDHKSIILGIQTADCVPVLIFDDQGTVIGGAHCGWKSAFGDILEHLITHMRSKGASNFSAIIGPSILQQSYEVNEDYYENFLSEDPENARFFMISENDGHFLFDLPSYVKWTLSLLNITSIVHINEDTYSMESKYPSYRRSVHFGKKHYESSILSTIMLL